MAATAAAEGGGSSSSSSSSTGNGEEEKEVVEDGSSSNQWSFDFGGSGMTEYSVDDPNPWRDEIVRTIFGDVGAIRRDFSCAIERKILLHGRLYVTDRFICFYSNLFGFEKKIKIPYSYITCITKEYTAVFIPNAIAVITARKEYIFRSFWDRDECYEVLRSMHDKFRGVVESGSLVEEEEEGGGANSAMQSFFESGQSLAAEEEVLEPVISVDESGVPDEEAVEEFAIERAESAIKHRAVPAKELSRDAESTGSMISLGSITSLGALAHVLNSTNLPISIDGFFRHFVADDAPFSLAKFHEFQGDSDVTNTPWAQSHWNEQESEQTRELRFVRRLNSPIGPSSTRTTKMQRCRQFGTRGIVVNTVMSMEDIPYKDCFTIEDRWVAEPVDAESTRVRFEFQVVWSKTTIWKRRIEYSSKQDLEKFYEAYVHAAHTYLDELKSPSAKLGRNDHDSTRGADDDLAASETRTAPDTQHHPPPTEAVATNDRSSLDASKALDEYAMTTEKTNGRAADSSVDGRHRQQQQQQQTPFSNDLLHRAHRGDKRLDNFFVEEKKRQALVVEKENSNGASSSSQFAAFIFTLFYTYRIPLLFLLFSLLFVTLVKQQAAMVEIVKVQHQLLAEINSLGDQIRKLEKSSRVRQNDTNP